MRSLTILLAVSGFPDSNSEDSKGLTAIKPSDVTRVAFDKSDFAKVAFSNETGPIKDGKVEVIDCMSLQGSDTVEGYDCAFIARIESTHGLDSFAIQAIGNTLQTYMERNACTEFAAAAIADLDVGQDLHGKWNTILFLRDDNGTWWAKNLRTTSVQKSSDDTYAILQAGKLAYCTRDAILKTLLDSTKLKQAIDDGYQLADKNAYLVRAPIHHGAAFTVITDGFQTVYDREFKIIASGKTGFMVMPSIDVDGEYSQNTVTTVSGKGDTWDIRTAIPASKADGLGQAYGATAA